MMYLYVVEFGWGNCALGNTSTPGQAFKNQEQGPVGVAQWLSISP